MRSICGLVLMGLLIGVGPLSAGTPRTNVILIVADDLGYGELGCYGQKKIQTPCLDQMAKEGLRFTQFYSGSPVCAPSRCCLMTGKHGGHAWVRDNRTMGKEGQTPVPTSEVMFPEIVKKSGYATAAMGKWGLGPPGSESDPIKRGFDLFFGYNCQAHAHYHYPTYLWRNDKHVTYPENNRTTGKTHSHDLFEKEALAFIEANKEKPFFLFLPITIPHVAIQAPDDWLAPYKGKWDDPPYDGKMGGYLAHPTPRAGYAAMITRMDKTVGAILDRVKSLKLDRHTLVLFTSDNGATHDVGGADTGFFNSVGNLRGRKGSVYEGGLRVPLIAWGPGIIRTSGMTTKHVSYFPDIMPTVLNEMGLRAATPTNIDGINFSPTMRAGVEPQQQHDQLVWVFPGYGGQMAVRVGDWKGVRRDISKGKGQMQLYNLARDEGEKEDVAEKHPDMVKKLAGILAKQHTPSKLFPIKGMKE